MNKLEKFFYNIGKWLGGDFEPDEETYILDHTTFYKHKPTFTTKKLDGRTIKDIIQIIDDYRIDIKRFGCSETKIATCKNSKIELKLTEKEDETIHIVKIKEDMDVTTGLKYLQTRHIFYTMDMDDSPIKISITTFSEYDDHDDNSIREACFAINTYFAQGMLKVSEIPSIVKNPDSISIPLSYDGMDVISTRKTSGYMSVLGDKNTYYSSGISKDESNRTFDGHFDDIIPYSNSETIDLSGYEDDQYDDSRIISLADAIKKRKEKEGIRFNY